MNNEKEPKVIDVQEFANSGKHVPPGKSYKIRIDREMYEVNVECMTGRQLLELAGKTPVERFQLNMKLKGGQVSKVEYNQTVCFTIPGLERFMTLPLDQTEG